MKVIALVYFFISFTMISYGQMTHKMNKMVGEWEYKNGSGIELWKAEQGNLHGYEYRVSKIGDTVKVEEMIIHTVNNNMIYIIEAHFRNTHSDSIKHHDNMKFIADKRTMKFYNIDESAPYSIHYSFGFLNRKKIKVKIQSGYNDKPVKLILTRIRS